MSTDVLTPDELFAYLELRQEELIRAHADAVIENCIYDCMDLLAEITARRLPLPGNMDLSCLQGIVTAIT